MVLVMALNIALCKFTEAFIQTDTNVMPLIIVVTMTAKVKAAKTTKQVCREIDHPNNDSDIRLFSDVIFVPFNDR